VELVKGDFNDPASLDAAMKGVDRAFLLSSAGPDQVKWAHNFIEAAKKNGVKHVVKLSALGADEKSTIGLAKWHGTTENELKKSGLGWTILQPHFFMQNAMMNAGSIKAQGMVYAPMKPDAKISAVDTRDIAAVAARTLLD